MAIDPVCKMEVDETKAAATSDYKGKKYYFCAAGCKKAFDQSPENWQSSVGYSETGTSYSFLLSSLASLSVNGELFGQNH